MSLAISNDRLAKGRKIYIHDSTETLVYTAQRGTGFPSPQWQVEKNGSEIATFKRKLFSATWVFKTTTGTVSVKRKLALRKKYLVVGGAYDGATAEANMPNSEITIEHQARQLALVTREPVSLTDTHQIDLLDTQEPTELLVVMIMISAMIDNLSANQGQSSDD